MRSQCRRGDCYDNAQAESLWSRLKTEMLELREWPVFADLADAQASIADYFDYYNHDRLHFSIGYQTPYHAHQQSLQTTALNCPAQRDHPGGPIAGAHRLPCVPSASGNRIAPLATGSTLPGAQPALTVYPNPFGEQMTVEFSLPVAGPATLAVYDIRNRLVQQVFSGPAEAGAPRRFALAGTGLAPGVYLVQLTTATQVFTRKLVRMN